MWWIAVKQRQKKLVNYLPIPYPVADNVRDDNKLYLNIRPYKQSERGFSRAADKSAGGGASFRIQSESEAEGRAPLQT